MLKRSAPALRRWTLFAGIALAVGSATQPARSARLLSWPDLPTPIQTRLQSAGVSADAFPAFVDRLNHVHQSRVREGDLDHLVFYLLQSTHFTRQAPIEPALSARALVEGLSESARAAYLQQGSAEITVVPPPVRTRARDLLRAIDSPDPDPRVVYFRQLVDAALPKDAEREPAVLREYLRATRFLYNKEFVAQRGPDAADAVSSLYRSRGLSTDTAVEAGYVVYLGLGVLKSLEPARRIRRVLIVGPGLDLAPRTGLIDEAPPESYQPWAVIDALAGLGLARLDDLQVVTADINPRVVSHLQRARANPPVLRLASGLQQSAQLSLQSEYREYFGLLGNAISASREPVHDANGHLTKSVQVQRSAADVLENARLDVITERLDGPPFDLAIATNILPYFDEMELGLALSNIASSLAPGGAFLHNEPRPAVMQDAALLGMPGVQSRQVTIATVKGAPPLADTIVIHRRR
jgi:hypothetical protein